MLAQYLDLTEAFNDTTASSVIFETSNYDYAVVQLINPSAEVFFSTTLDSGAITGVTDGNYVSSINYSTCYATNLADNTIITSSATSSLSRFNVVGRYIKLAKSDKADTATKVLVMLTKIS